MNSVLIAVGTELFQFNAIGGITPIFLSGVARYPIRAFGRIGAALGTLKGNDEADAFSHDKLPGLQWANLKHSLPLFHDCPEISSL